MLNLFLSQFFVRLSLCMHASLNVLLNNKNAFIFFPSFYHSYTIVFLPPISILCEGLISLLFPFPSSHSPSPFMPGLSSCPPRIFWFNQTCLGASPSAHGFWSASQSSWAWAWLSYFVISLSLCLSFFLSLSLSLSLSLFFTRWLSVALSPSTFSAAPHLNCLFLCLQNHSCTYCFSFFSVATSITLCLPVHHMYYFFTTFAL